MALVIEDKRRWVKRSTVASEKPTIPPSNDHTDGSWSATDIYIGELFLNMPDGLVYTRTDTNDIVEINKENGVISGLEITNGSDSVTFNVSLGDFRAKNRLYTHPATSDEFTVADGDVTNPRLDLIYIDTSNAVQVVTGVPSTNPVAPALPVDTILLGYILVPDNHTSGGVTITPFTVDRYEHRNKVLENWNTSDAWLVGMHTVESNRLYQCLVPHIGGVFATDLGNAYWQEIGGGSGVIGVAEDGDYTDGLFTDFTPTTPTGTPIDRFNEVLKELVPPPAPSLSDWSGDKTIKVDGNLSFDTANPIATYRAADDVGIPSPVTVDGLFAESGKRLAITPASGGGDITGVLNDQVSAHPSVPTGAYVADSFGEAELGDLNMYINGVLVATVDLTSTTGAIDGTSGGTVTGMSVSAQEASKFPQGSNFATYQNRTGTWLVKEASLGNGYNDIIVEHDTGTTIYTLDRFEVVVDADTTATSFSGEVLDSPVMTGSKKISGIDYHTGGTCDYDITIDNAYRNTYSDEADAISHTGVKCSAPVQALATNGGDEAQQVVITNKVVTITPSGIRIIDGAIEIDTTVKRTVQSTLSSTGVSQGELLLDNVSASSTITQENFDDETYRMPSNAAFETFASFTTGMWDGENSIADADAIAGYDDGLQVIDGGLIYPTYDFTTANIIHASSWNDGGTKGGARNYTGQTGNKTYIRWFQQVSPSVSNFTIQINGNASIDFVDLGTALNSNRAHVEIKAPSQTGWMDAYVDYSTGLTGDGDGARSLATGTGGINNVLGLTIGTKSTANTGGYMLVRITVASSFAHDFSDITFNFG